MFPIIRIGPFVMQTPGLVLLVGFWVGSLLAEREARRLDLQASTVNTGIFLALVAGLLGARLVYVARYLNTYLASPAGILSLNPSALAVPEGIVIGVLAAWFYWWVKDMPFKRTLDGITPLLAVLAVALGVSHLASGSAYGAPARIPWAIYLWDDYRHPSQVYEILAAVLVFGAVWGIRQSSSFPGFLFLLWTSLTAAARLLLESYRGDSTAVFGGLRTAQLAALGVLLLALWLMGKWERTPSARSPSAQSQVEDRSAPAS